MILVRHAAVAVDRRVPAAEWGLSAAGRAASVVLAQRLTAHSPSLIVTSVAPKASQTGAILAECLGLELVTAEGLHEHDRTSEPFVEPDEWHAQMRRFFGEPDALVYGRETATAAADRFAAAVARHPDDAAIVAHGTVITLLVARHNPKLDAFEFWERFAPGAYVVVDMPGYRCDAGEPTCIEVE